jgi:MATE family multidrug resistance protein
VGKVVGYSVAMTQEPALSPKAAPPPPLSRRGHGRAVLVLGLPLIGSHLAQVALQITDTLMMGWYSVEALAALVLGATAFFTIFIMGSGFAWAVMPMVAHAAGSGEETEVRRVTRMGLWLSALFGVLVLPFFWFSGSILRGMGQDAGVSALAQDYLRIMGPGMVPALLVMVLKSYLAALERTQIVLWTTVVAALLNVPLNWILIFGNLGAPALGVEGAAIGSVIVQVLSLLVLAVYVARLRALSRYALFQRIWRPDWPAFIRVFRLGWPIGLTNLAEAGLFMASAVLMGWIGTRELAAHGIAIEITSAVFMIHLGLSNAATVRAGRAVGASDGFALRRGAKVAMALSLGMAASFMALYWLLPAQMMGLFLAPDDPERPMVIAIGVSLLAVAAVFQLTDAAQVMAMGLLRGIQDTRVPLIIAVFSYWGIGIPASWLLGVYLGYGGEGVWAGLVAGLTVAAILMNWRFWRKAARFGG